MKADEYKRRVTAYLRSGKATDEDWDLVASLLRIAYWSNFACSHDASECECFFSPAIDAFHRRVFGEPVACPKCGEWVTPGFWCPGCDEAPEAKPLTKKQRETLIELLARSARNGRQGKPKRHNQKACKENTDGG